MSSVRIDLDGLYAFLFGFPAMVIACVIVGLCLFFSPYRWLKIIAGVVAFLALLIGLVCIPDLLTMLRGADYFELAFIVAYFAFIALLSYLSFRLYLSQRPIRGPIVR